MNERFLFELVTPEKLAYCAEVEMVEVPGELGDFGVLAGHAPFFSMIRPGVIRVHGEAEETQSFFVPSGYAEVNPQGCRVLSEHVTDLADYTLEEAQLHLQDCESAYGDCTSEAARTKAQKTIESARALRDALL